MVAARPKPGVRVLLIGALLFGLGCATAAAMPNYALFGVVLIVVGIAAQTVTTSTNSYVQTSTEHNMRGRVTAILLAIALGGTPVGAPIVGWIADAFGPRWALGVGAASGLLAAATAFIYLAARSNESADTGAT
jgi:MFS family permease